MRPSPWTALTALGLTSWQAFAAPLVLAIDDWCPYICSSTGAKRGILVDVVEEVFKTNGLSVTFAWLPFAREAEAVRLNKVQGMVGIIKPGAPDLVFPDEPVITTQFCFFTLPQSHWTFQGFQQRYPKIKMGMVNGISIDPEFDRSFPNVTKQLGDTGVTIRLTKMLQRHRVDAFAEDRLNVSYTLAKNKMPPLRIAGCVAAKDEYVAFSPSDPHSGEYAQLFSDGIRKLKKSGRFKQIVSSYVAE